MVALAPGVSRWRSPPDGLRGLWPTWWKEPDRECLKFNGKRRRPHQAVSGDPVSRSATLAS